MESEGRIHAENNAENLPPDANEAGPSSHYSIVHEKHTILRVKRKLADIPHDELILEAALTTKRHKPDALSSVLGQLNLASSAASNAATATVKKRRRFVLLSSVSAKSMQAGESAGLHEWVSGGLTGHRPSIRSVQVHARDAGDSRREEAAQARREARYQQVKQKRLKQGTVQLGPGGDKLSEQFNVYDLEKLASPPPAPAKKEPAKNPESIAKFMSMLEDYYHEQGQEVPEDVSTAKQEAEEVAHRVPDPLPVAEPSGEECSEDEYVYDVYVPVEAALADSAVDEDQGVPVVQVDEQDDQYHWETMDGAESDPDSEDSNAESYSGNTYPDEGSSFYDEQEGFRDSDFSDKDDGASTDDDYDEWTGSVRMAMPLHETAGHGGADVDVGRGIKWT